MADLSFNSFNFPQEISSVLEEHGFQAPTPIQEQAIPSLLEGKDLLGTAQTGTGKTLAFALPMVVRLLANPKQSLLVLVPTRELAQQVLKTFLMLTKKTRGLKTALLIGGAYMRLQCQDLARGPRIIVGTPGRVIDHIERRTLKTDGIQCVVLDEMDRMLDMGFGEQLSEIFSKLPTDQPRQTAMFSATLPPHIGKLAHQYLTNPVKVSIGQHSQPVAKIKQDVLFIKQGEKQNKLIEILGDRVQQSAPGSCIVFVKTKIECGDLATLLCDYGFKAAAMHGDLNQSKRQRVLQDFRTQKVNVLVATDIAARGIDVSHIRLVVNYELPQAAEDYVHRIGRTARGGADGVSISFVAPFDQRKWGEILKLTNPEEAKAFFASQQQSRNQPRSSHGPRSRGSNGSGYGNGGGSHFGQQRNSRFGGRSSEGGEFRSNRFDDSRSGSFRGGERGGDRFEKRSERSERSERPAGAPQSEYRGNRGGQQDGYNSQKRYGGHNESRRFDRDNQRSGGERQRSNRGPARPHNNVPSRAYRVTEGRVSAE